MSGGTGYWAERYDIAVKEKGIVEAKLRACQRDASPWHPAIEPPKQTEWVIAWADGTVRCVAWNSDKRCWEDWDGHRAIDLDGIEWWMSIPDVPEKANAALRRGEAVASKGSLAEQSKGAGQ